MIPCPALHYDSPSPNNVSLSLDPLSTLPHCISVRLSLDAFCTNDATSHSRRDNSGYGLERGAGYIKTDAGTIKLTRVVQVCSCLSFPSATAASDAGAVTLVLLYILGGRTKPQPLLYVLPQTGRRRLLFSTNLALALLARASDLVDHTDTRLIALGCLAAGGLAAFRVRRAIEGV